MTAHCINIYDINCLLIKSTIDKYSRILGSHVKSQRRQTDTNTQLRKGIEATDKQRGFQ